MADVIRSRSGYLVRRDGAPVDRAALHVQRLASIAAVVDELGVVAALDRYEGAYLVLLKLAADAEKRGHFGAARGFTAASAYAAENVRLLVEHHG